MLRGWGVASLDSVKQDVRSRVLFVAGFAASIALLDRVLHHAETVVIEGKSYRMKDQIDPEPHT